MAKQQLPEDFKEFIQCLNLNNVKYLLVGGWAVGLYGHPRATKDIVIENIKIPLISKEDLIMNKKSTGRLSDMADVEKLEYDKDKKKKP